MKLLFDQNLSRKLASKLSNIFPNSSHIQFHQLVEADDSEVGELTLANDFCIVTQDAPLPKKAVCLLRHPK